MLVVAYIGFGNSVCRYHLPYVERRKDTIKVKYIYRRMEDRVGDEERETWYPDINFTSDIDEVMNDEEVNLIVVNTPDQFHTYYTKMAIEHGKNCLCEKPFAMSVEEAKEVIETGVLGELLEIESHYDYYRPSIADRKGLGMLYGLQVHPIDQIVGEFGVPDKVVYDCRSYDNLGNSDDYSDIDLFYGKMKAIVKTSFYVKLEYPRFIVHGRKGSFIMPQLGHQSALKAKPGPVEISFEPLPEKYWGTLCYVDENGEDVTKKVPVEIQDYGMIYDNLYEVIFNHGEKIVADEEVLEVLRILEQATEVAKEAR